MTERGSGDAACPVCGKPRVERFRPFCSRRCQQVDLHRWLGGNYRVQVNDPDEEPLEDGRDSAT